MIMDLYYANVAFNPENQDPIVHYVENRNYLSFSRSLSKEMLIEVGTYEI